MSDTLAGTLPASPIATPTRSTTSMAKLVASPHSAVIPLHRASEMTMIQRRLQRSASRAIGSDSVA